jgi:hypothetical protein
MVGAERSVHDAEEPSAVPAEFRQRIVELVRKGRTPEELGRQFVDPVPTRSLTAARDDWDAARALVRPKAPHHFAPDHHRHPKVGDDDVGQGLGCLLDALASITRFLDSEALQVEHRGEHVSGVVRVFDHQNERPLNLHVAAKRLELLLQAVPGLRRVGILWDPSFPPAQLELRGTQEAARSLRVKLHMFPVRDVAGFENAVTRDHVGAIEVLPATVFTAQRQRIADLVAKARLPAMFQRREFVVAGGLMSYGPSYAEMYRRAAIYVDKILKGAQPAIYP